MITERHLVNHHEGYCIFRTIWNSLAWRDKHKRDAFCCDKINRLHKIIYFIFICRNKVARTTESFRINSGQEKYTKDDIDALTGRQNVGKLKVTQLLLSDKVVTDHSISRDLDVQAEALYVYTGLYIFKDVSRYGEAVSETSNSLL